MNINYFLLLIYAQTIIGAEDYYELLGVARSANTKEIRKAFKKLALTLHPDKNKDDKSSQDRFVKITRAYEVLKDEEKRRQYDIHGDQEQWNGRTSYKSYDYYAHHFGLYDEDLNVVTLSGSDFDAAVDLSYDGGGQWFITFYSPVCGSCHTAAPAWSRLAADLSGAVTFAAVNCEDDWIVCRQTAHVTSYPTYILYPSGEILTGVRGKEELRNFVLERLETGLNLIDKEDTWSQLMSTSDRWLLMLTDSGWPSSEARIIGAMLRGLVTVGVVDCSSEFSCEKLRAHKSSSPQASIVYLEKRSDSWDTTPIRMDEPREVTNQVLDLLPEIASMDPNSFQNLIEQLSLGSSKPLLVYYHMGPSSQLDTDIKKLVALLPNFIIAKLNCGRHPSLCSSEDIARYPQFVVYKPSSGGNRSPVREYHHGAHTVHAIAAFAKESSQAVNFKAVGPQELLEEIDQGAVLVDFYAPWCPPCLKLIPELRKASLLFAPSVVGFSSIDCTVHSKFCQERSVTSYPTTVLYNTTKKPVPLSERTASMIIEFVEDAISPKVINLDKESFHEIVGKKSNDEVWLVKFSLPWCHPCQAMASNYRKLAKIMADNEMVKFGDVNCEDQSELCEQQRVKSYPHLRLYPRDSEGLSTVMIYSGTQRDTGSLRRWLFHFLPSPLTHITPDEFREAFASGKPFLVDFYAPWCGHCVAFEPDFTTVAQKLDGKVRCVQLNCEKHYTFCRDIKVVGYPTVRFYIHSKDHEIDSQNPSIIIERVERLLNIVETHDEL